MVRDSLIVPWYKQRWPWLLIAGPALVVVAGAITVWLAVVSNDGLVVDDYYKQGLAVNQRLHRDQQASDLGMAADLMRSGANVRLLLTAGLETQMPSEVAIKISHPTRAGQDQILRVTQEAPGFYSGKLTDEIAGRWLVTIEDPAAKWRLHGEWHADSDEPLHLSPIK
ncbi:FixH family protein [Dechloromonas sp. ZY10]|uniref:FixH family protein n=1 Tax=Dechloromonas aquae TaxID=2664436 RepID=UPI003528FDF6